MALIRHHFPDSTLDKAVGRHKHRLGIWRSEYNRGLLVGKPRAVFSVAYYNGKPVDATGKEMSDVELERRSKGSIVIGTTTISLKAVDGRSVTLEIKGDTSATFVQRCGESKSDLSSNEDTAD